MKAVSIAAALLLTSATAHAKSLHVHVDEAGGDRVSITMPLSIARAALSIAGTTTIEIEDEELSGEQLRALWKEVKGTGEKDLVRVDTKDENVRITREKGEVRVSVREKDGAKVSIRMPEDAIDALLSGTGNQLEVGAALKRIHESFTGELVRVEDRNETVRIWVD